jgi:hypothetical protein
VWSVILILIVSVISGLILANKVDPEALDIKLSGIFLFIIVFSAELIPLIHFRLVEVPSFQAIFNYLSISTFALILTMLLMTIRWLRPEIARYPYPFVFVPLLIIAFFPFIEGTESITNIILLMIQAGSILVLALLITLHYKHFQKGWMIILSLLSFIAAFTIFWIIPGFADIQIWMWKPFIAIGMFTFSLTYPNLLSDKYVNY